MNITTKNFTFNHLEKSDLKIIHSYTSNYSNISEYWTTHIRHLTYWEKKWDKTGLWDDDFGMLSIKDNKKKIIGIIWYFKGIKYCEGLEMGWNFFKKPEKKIFFKTVRAFIAYLFSTFNIPRIQSNTLIPDIVRMKDFLNYTGFVHEGTMRKAMYVRSKLIDLQLFSVLSKDYKSLKEELDFIDDVK